MDGRRFRFRLVFEGVASRLLGLKGQLVNTFEEQLRADFLDYLYDKYGRTNGCYTGLWKQYQEDISLQMRKAVIEGRVKLECGYAESKKLA